jgi:hypothetical protein
MEERLSQGWEKAKASVPLEESTETPATTEAAAPDTAPLETVETTETTETTEEAPAVTAAAAEDEFNV